MALNPAFFHLIQISDTTISNSPDTAKGFVNIAIHFSQKDATGGLSISSMTTIFGPSIMAIYSR